MDLLSREQYIKLMNLLKEKIPGTLGNPKSTGYINIDKANNIWKLLEDKRKIKQFLIGGILEKFVRRFNLKIWFERTARSL